MNRVDVMAQVNHPAELGDPVETVGYSYERIDCRNDVLPGGRSPRGTNWSGLRVTRR